MERKVICRRESIFGDEFSFFLKHRSEDGRIFLAAPLVLEELKQEDCVLTPRPTFVLRPEEVQALMDSLWDCGLRPSEGSGSAGAMAATQKHLEDMRTLVFNPPAKRNMTPQEEIEKFGQIQ